MMPRIGIGAAFALLLVPAVGAEVPGTRFLLRADADTLSAGLAHIEHPLLDDNPGAIVLVTPVWNPRGDAEGVYVPHTVGVYYSVGEGHWTIYYEDDTNVQFGTAYNVFVPAAGPSAFVHESTDPNSTLNYTTIDNAATNGNQGHLLFVTHAYNAGGGLGEFHPENIGVWYDGVPDRWAIFNEDKDNDAMAFGHEFHVFVAPSDPAVFVHTSTEENTATNSTYLDHAALNGNPEAWILITHNWNPTGNSGVNVDEQFGVWYDHDADRWAIFVQDESDLPEGVHFNVLVDSQAIFINGFEGLDACDWNTNDPYC